MRVLFITGEFPPMPGGVGACTQEIARALVALGAEVGVLTSTRAQPVIRNSREAFVIRPEISKWNWFSISKIARVMREFSPDVIHIQYQTGAFAMHPAINFLPRLFSLFPSFPSHPKFVTTFHDLRVPYLFPKAGRVRDWVTRELARNCDAVIATNDEDFLKLETWDVKPALIPIGSNVTTQPFPNYQREVWRAQIGVAENETLVGYFGFLNHSKGGETLIRALAHIPDAKLLLIGGQLGASDPTDVAYRARVQALSAELDVSARVIWTNFAPDEIISAHFHACDVIALPYRDGASYRRGTLMAALAHGCAIVTTQVKSEKLKVKSVLPELRDGENCLLIPPDDPGALVNAIQRAMASPELRAKISAGARDLAQNFTWDKIAQQHFALYETVCSGD